MHYTHKTNKLFINQKIVGHCTSSIRYEIDTKYDTNDHESDYYGFSKWCSVLTNTFFFFTTRRWSFRFLYLILLMHVCRQFHTYFTTPLRFIFILYSAFIAKQMNIIALNASRQPFNWGGKKTTEILSGVHTSFDLFFFMLQAKSQRKEFFFTLIECINGILNWWFYFSHDECLLYMRLPTKMISTHSFLSHYKSMRCDAMWIEYT